MPSPTRISHEAGVHAAGTAGRTPGSPAPGSGPTPATGWRTNSGASFEAEYSVRAR